MQILNWIPSHALQIRYIHPYYESDVDGDNYCINEDEATDVWYDIIKPVVRTKRPMYYRRRTLNLARQDRFIWQDYIHNQNRYENEWEKCTHVRVKVIGRRVLFIYDEEFVRKYWDTMREKRKLNAKLLKLKDTKFTYKEKKEKEENPFTTKLLTESGADWLDNYMEAIDDNYNRN